MQKNKKTIWITVGVIVVIIIILIASRGNKKPEIVNELPINTNNTEVIQATPAKPAVKNVKNSASTISYEDALVQYRDYRIQLNKDCQAIPNNVTYKNGTSIMIDNRSSVERDVRVGSNYTIPAWGFKIINLTSSTLPATWLVDCGAQQNVATILIQK
jgi:hypothetical protein